MFKVRDLMIHAAQRTVAAPIGGGIICYWPSADCCGPAWSNPGGGNIGTSRWFGTIDDFQACPTRSVTLGTGGCGFNYSTCPGASVTDLRAHISNVINPVELKKLKVELESALELANQMERDFERDFTPSNLSEIEQLEKQLKGALKELQQRKKGLEE